MLSALPYLGGKSPRAPQRVGKWIADQLPHRTAYLEPFAGMLGVLLHRKPAAQEYVNDLDRRITNWWEVIRDRWEEFNDNLWRISLTSEFQHHWAQLNIDHPDPITAALALTTLAYTQAASGGYRLSINKPAGRRLLNEDDVKALAQRMGRVSILNRDACAVLERMEEEPAMVIYVDPPYRSSPGANIYNTSEVDWDRLTDTLLKQQGAVAVSGYNDEWDHLGWRVETKTTYSSFVISDGAQPGREEKLWLNYPPLSPTLL